MTESFIAKLQPDPDGLDFEGLRREAIRLVQEVSGDIWSDYNLHDPGVTILEVLCYALTDMIYRAGFAAADYLAAENGEIDYKQQGLYRPDEILPCAPLTENDYRKLILDSLADVDNVWIKRRSMQAGELSGLYFIYVQLNEQAMHQHGVDANKFYTEKIAKLYSANRNLCEDLAGVEIAEHKHYSLCGEIEIGGTRDSASILADVYYACSQYLTPGIPVQSYAEMYKNGSCLEELFTGVLTGQGYIAEEALHKWRGDFSITELIGKVARIEGVRNIKHLSFKEEGAAQDKEIDRITLGMVHGCLPVAYLHFPVAQEELQIKLNKSGNPLPLSVSVADVEIEYIKLQNKFQAQRHLKQTFDWVASLLPGATLRNIGEYNSIQNHFPGTYGLNAFGVPESASPQRKAQAAQLKAYLLLFEQVMANFLQNTQEIRTLFSLNKKVKQSYFYQALSNNEVPNAESVYVKGIDNLHADLKELVAGFDNYADRKNRVLDYLLGLYGEKLSANSLRQFFGEFDDTDEIRIANKIAFLRDIVDVNKSRAAAFDYRMPVDTIKNCSGLQKKLRVLLGMQSSNNADPYANEIHFVEHILLRPQGTSSHPAHQVPGDFYSFRLSVIFPADSGQFAKKGFQNLAEETVRLNCPAHIFPEIFWLNSVQLGRFLTLQKRWLNVKLATNPSSDSANSASGELIIFLRGLGKNTNA